MHGHVRIRGGVVTTTPGSGIEGREAGGGTREAILRARPFGYVARMPSQSTLDRLPRIERLAAFVQVAGVLLLAAGPVAGLVTMLYQSSVDGVEGRYHTAEGVVVLVSSVVAGLTLLMNAAYVQHRLILDRHDAQQD